MSDHLPLCMYIDLPVNCLQFTETKHFLPKPKWYSADSDMIQRYRKRLDMYLNQIIISDHVLDCKNVLCDVHNNSIQFLHDSIINALHKSASDVLKFTKPYKGTQKKIIPGWNDLVLPFKTDALEWHHIWQNCGCPPSGYVFDMRKLSRHNYHQQIKLAHRNEAKIKVEKVANSYIEKPNS